MWSRPRSGCAASAVADSGGSITQTLVVVVLFIGAMAMAPWLLRQWQQRASAAQAQTGIASKVVSVVAVGPQQRVVTVEIILDQEKTRLVLGVTAQAIQCLHVLPATPTLTTATVALSDAMPFAQMMAQANQASPAQVITAKDAGHV